MVRYFQQVGVLEHSTVKDGNDIREYIKLLGMIERGEIIECDSPH